MGKCIHHPERESNFLCMKHNVYLCEECLGCRDPELYCKFRPSCPIWFIHKQKKREQRKRLEQGAAMTSIMGEQSNAPESKNEELAN